MRSHDIGPALVARLPAKVGDSFESLNGPAVVIETDIRVTVPAGQFRTVHYRTTNGNVIIDDWFAPGIGSVRSQTQIDDTVFRSELRSFVFP